MPIQGRYIGQTEPNYMGMKILHNAVYPIDILPHRRGYNWVVKIYDVSLFGFISKLLTGQYKEKAWIPYDEYPSKYWVINTNTNYEMIGAANPQLNMTRPLLPSFCPRG